MPKQLALFYREHMNDYVVNNRGQFYYGQKTCAAFPQFSEALDYIVQNYSGRKSELVIDAHVREKRRSELESKLKGTKVEVKSQ
ncbi:hypothetical protein HZC30_01735 [Candidatus Woesearchaeota archaeon]|nr:hypothetical protein [Candidatus Woesearchaeota archaeon]